MAIRQTIESFLYRSNTWQGSTMEFWMRNVLPKGVSEAQHKYNEEAEPHLVRLGQRFEINDMAQYPLVSEQMDRAHQKIIDLRRDIVHRQRDRIPDTDEAPEVLGEGDLAGRHSFRMMNLLRTRARKLDAQAKFIREEFLPRLKELERGADPEPMDMQMIAQVMEGSRDFFRLYREDAPGEYQPDPEAAKAFYSFLGQLSAQIHGSGVGRPLARHANRALDLG